MHSTYVYLPFLAAGMVLGAVAPKSAGPTTNAKRLAEGKTPLKPRKLYGMNPADSAPRTKRSVTASTGDFNCCSPLSCVAPACCTSGSFSGTDPDYDSTDCYIDPTWNADLGQSQATCNNAGSPGAAGGYQGVCCGGVQATGPYNGNDFSYFAATASNCYFG